MKTASPRVAFFDIETAPSKGFFWGRLWETNIISVTEPWYMLSFAYKWMGENKVHWRGLPDYKRFKRDKADDKSLLAELHAVLTEADIVIAHNGDKFDIRKTNARFAIQNFLPPKPYKTIDTLKVARYYFDFESNKLNDLATYLGIGKKLPHTGFDLWKRCMDGERSAWKTMEAYNVHDVELLAGVYERLKPYMTSHPDLNAHAQAALKRAGRPSTVASIQCPTCQSWNTKCIGPRVFIKRAYHLFHCLNCGAWPKGKLIK